MGSGRYDADLYGRMKSSRVSSGTPHFAYSAGMAATPVDKRKAHDSLDPKTILAPDGSHVRESCDGPDHPDSRPVAVIFDVTGSMGHIPQVFQDKLSGLMAMLVAKAGLEHPHVLVGAVGDCYCDSVPFQVSQFESDNRIDEQLRNIYLEGGGGGQVSESYALAFYFAAYHTRLDCFTKRNQKGYLFVTGDEMAYLDTPRSQIEAVFGRASEGPFDTKALIAKAQETFEVFFVIATQGSHGKDPRIIDSWRDLLGERALSIDDPALICELIAGTVALCEGTADVDSVGSALGLSDKDGAKVSGALAKFAKAGAGVAKVSGSLPAISTGAPVARL